MSERSDEPPVKIPIGPELDLHSFLPEDLPSVVGEYIEAAVRAGIGRIRIVHGRGRGVQRAIVQSVLKRHPSVVACQDDPTSLLGATFADLLL
jgi:dsDNA-specific endonuclease/ATPase MutS2